MIDRETGASLQVGLSAGHRGDLDFAQAMPPARSDDRAAADQLDTGAPGLLRTFGRYGFAAVHDGGYFQSRLTQLG